MEEWGVYKIQKQRGKYSDYMDLNRDLVGNHT